MSELKPAVRPIPCARGVSDMSCVLKCYCFHLRTELLGLGLLSVDLNLSEKNNFPEGGGGAIYV